MFGTDDACGDDFPIKAMRLLEVKETLRLRHGI